MNKILWLRSYVNFLNHWFLHVSEAPAVIDAWFELVQKRIDHRGPVETIAYIKGCRLCFTRYICGQPLSEPPVPGIRLSSDGLPCGILLDLMRKDDIASLRLAHTLLLVSRCIKGTTAPNLETVTSPSTSIDPQVFEEEIRAVVQSLGWRIQKPIWESVHLSTKAGPNGQAMMGAMSDLHLLSPRMLELIEYLSDGKVNHLIERLRLFSLDLFNNHFGIKPKGIISKLSVVKDKEAKARIIAILDYWTQTTLRPLHLGLFALLKRIKGDCTFNQASFRSFLPTKGPYFSFHLSAATDRFPLDFQRIVISAVLNDDKYGSCWAELLSDREFDVPWTGGRVKYSCGQPMGAYSSWSAFALSHHIVVRIAAIRAGLSHTFSSYALLGDDIVLSNSDVAREYLNIISQLGVTISPTKSHSSEHSYEFAKRWVHKGQEMTGAPLSLIADSRKLKWFIAAQWIRDIEARWCTVSCLATRSLFVHLFSLTSISKGYAYRLGYKAYSFYCLPIKGERYHDRLCKALYFADAFFDNVIGCNRPRFALTLMWEWLAEAKTNVIEGTLKDQTRKLNTFLSELSNLSGLIPEGMDSQSALLTLVPVAVVIDNLRCMQTAFEKLRSDFTSGRERRICEDASSYSRSIDPTKIWSKRQSIIVLYNSASLVNKFSKMASIYTVNREKLLAMPHNSFPEGTNDASFVSLTDKQM